MTTLALPPSWPLPALHRALPKAEGQARLALTALPAPLARPPEFAHCLLLAVLLHVWLVLLLGNAPGGTARQGEGVWGAVNISLRGPETPGVAELAPPPVPNGPAGEAASPRWGGAVRENTAPPAPPEPGAAQVGTWSATAAPAVAEPVPPPPPGRVVDEQPSPTPLARTAATRPVPAAAVPALPMTSPVSPLALPAAGPALPALAPALAPVVAPVVAQPVAQPVAAPADAPAPPPAPAALLATAPTPATQAAPSPPAERSLSAPHWREPLRDSAPLPRALPQALQPTPQPSASALKAPELAAPLVAPALAPAPAAPALAAPAPVAPAMPDTPAAEAAPRRLAAPPAPNITAPSAALPRLPAATTAAPALQPMPTLPTLGAAPTAAPTAVPAAATPHSLPGAPDAGNRLGQDVASPPAAAASAPARLNLELARPRGGELSRFSTPGALPLLPRPPEVDDKLGRAIQKAAKADCRTAYTGAGVLAVVPLAADALRKDGGCRW